VRGRTVDEPEQKAVFSLSLSLSVRSSLFSGRFYETRTEKERRRKNEKGSATEKDRERSRGRGR